jgi:hypothetical protein
VDATLPLLAATPDNPFGQLDEEKWKLFAAWMAEHDLISGVPETDEVLTNELLPGAEEQ